MSSLLVYMETATRLRDEHTNANTHRNATTGQAVRAGSAMSTVELLARKANSLIEAAKSVNPDVLSINVLEANRNPFAARERLIPFPGESIT
ncbi:MAG: hypothetical protein IPH35_18340 [Rhodoferax sp.]|nr:hypothetical protein [Rhodoferax sp.]